MSRTSAIATAVLGALLLTSCAAPDPEPELESSGQTSSSTETSEPPTPAGAEESEIEPVGPTFDYLHGINAADGGGGRMNEAPLPNGTFRLIDGVYGVDALLGNPATEIEGPDVANVDCASNWDSVQFQWLRAWAEQPDLGLAEDYHYGATAGPTCFAGPGGAVTGPDHRLVHYVCQSSNTAARTLFSRAGGGTVAWTPEFTTEDESVCFSFGEEVRAYQAEVSSTQ